MDADLRFDVSISSTSRAGFPGLFLAIALAPSLTAAAVQDARPAAPSVPEPTATGTEQSLAAAARSSKKPPSSRAKKVITEDDMNALRNALPALTMDGPENSDEIVAAIGRYRQTHSPEETEAAVQAWYDKYDQDLGAAIQQNLVVSSLREENQSNRFEMCRESEDYRTCENLRRAEYIGLRHDQLTINTNAALEVRIQHAFMRVRGGLFQYHLRYDWFKIRTANGIDKY